MATDSSGLRSCDETRAVRGFLRILAAARVSYLMSISINGSNELFNFACAHSSLMKKNSGILLVVKIMAAHFDATGATALFPDIYSVGLF